MNFNYFVIPFTIGILFCITTVIILFIKWFKKFEKSSKIKFYKLFISPLNLILVIKDIFLESLLHRRIFKTNIILGYMHSSFAFGWFLLIVTGFIETTLLHQTIFHPIYEPIFFKYFHHKVYNKTINFLMDLFLLYVLSGILLAILKRIYKRLFGLKNNTKLNTINKIALISLWLIFPARLIAESTTAAIYHNGDFLTQNFAKIVSSVVNPLNIEIYTWWAYSIILFIFFITVPFSRYMHIPTEMFFIALKRAGVKFENNNLGIRKVEIYSCSSCGICIESCQLNNDLQRKSMVPAYYLYKLRKNNSTKKNTYDCLMCGRCQELCPVKIDILDIKLSIRQNYMNRLLQDYNFIKYNVINNNNLKIGYFAGCMTHLTPSILSSMEKIFKYTNTPYIFIDEDSTICCGRPLKLAGKQNDAEYIVKKNTEYINSLNLNLLITSCPICYKIFLEDYIYLNTKVLHHTQWLYELLKTKKIILNKSNQTVIYHDPCELGRGTNVYEEPRLIISAIYNLLETKASKNNSLCCGGSLGNFYTNELEKIKIAQNTLKKIISHNVDKIITACPLCKKTFQKSSDYVIKDICEIVAENLHTKIDFQ